MNILSTLIIHSIMTYNMPTLPYANDALEPVISQETIDYHYGKHLQTYINNLNALVPGTNDEGKSLEEIVATTNDTPIFNNVGQVLNHTLYFLQFTPAPQSKEPTGKLSEAICKNCGRFENFKNTMNRLLELGAIPIVYENDTVATDEIVIGDNDTLAARIAVLSDAVPIKV